MARIPEGFWALVAGMLREGWRREEAQEGDGLALEGVMSEDDKLCVAEGTRRMLESEAEDWWWCKAVLRGGARARDGEDDPDLGGKSW